MVQDNKVRTTVNIYNNTYTIVSKEDSDHIRLVADLVDDKMQEIHEANRHLDTAKLAVLTAVNAMNDFVKIQEEYDSLVHSIKKKEDK